MKNIIKQNSGRSIYDYFRLITFTHTKKGNKKNGREIGFSIFSQVRR